MSLKPEVTSLVTGGAGFIGSHLCEKLLTKGNHVICLDNLFSGKMSNIEHLENNPKFTFVYGDVTLPWSIPIVHEIYNLAAPAAPNHYRRDPITTLKTIVWGTSSMLELAKQNKAKFLQASTSEVYGDSSISPIKEDYFGNVNPTGSRSCYDEGKRCAETLVYDFYRMYDIDVKIARIFNTYGPRMVLDDGRLVPSFVVSALRGLDIEIQIGIPVEWSFTYVDDIVDALIKLMDSSKEFKDPVNLGNPEPILIRDLAKLIIQSTKSTSSIISIPKFMPLRQRVPDISLAKSMLNWEPLTPLDKGLESLIDYTKLHISESLYV